MDKLKILFYSLELTKHKLLSSRFRSLCLIYAGFVWVNMSSIRSFIEATNYPVSIYISYYADTYKVQNDYKFLLCISFFRCSFFTVQQDVFID